MGLGPVGQGRGAAGRFGAVLATVAALAGCAGGERGERPAADAPPLPEVAMRLPRDPGGGLPGRPNAELARDYLDLVFRLENGRPVERLTRFEGPVTVSMTGAVPPTAARDLDALLGRLRSEAGIAISRVPSGGRITVAFVPRRQMRARVPAAACFTVPNLSGWREYLRARGTARLDWAGLESRSRAAVFIPSDTAPQEVRDCLHEEIAQALGPVDDLYRLSDSVFDDDNFLGTLTGFDMLMLRIHHAPAMRDGMSRAEAAAALPAVLAVLNPGGGPAGPVDPGWVEDTPRRYVADIETALGGGSLPARRAAAAAALQVAQGMGWGDGRLAFALYTFGRLNLSGDAEAAVAALAEAGAIYAGLGAGMARAHVDLYLAGVALQIGTPGDVLMLTGRALPVAVQGGNAALAASLLAMRAEALLAQGDGAGAARARLDSAGWAGYGFGSQAAARLAEIAALGAGARAARAGAAGQTDAASPRGAGTE